MKTWILCVDQLGAKLYWRSGAKDPAHFWMQIPYPSTEETYIQYIARMTQETCASDSRSCLIVCAEPPILKAICRYFNPATQSRIIGSISCNLCHVSNDRLDASTQEFLESKAQRGLAPVLAASL